MVAVSITTVVVLVLQELTIQTLPTEHLVALVVAAAVHMMVMVALVDFMVVVLVVRITVLLVLAHKVLLYLYI